MPFLWFHPLFLLCAIALRFRHCAVWEQCLCHVPCRLSHPLSCRLLFHNARSLSGNCPFHCDSSGCVDPAPLCPEAVFQCHRNSLQFPGSWKTEPNITSSVMPMVSKRTASVICTSFSGTYVPKGGPSSKPPCLLIVNWNIKQCSLWILDRFWNKDSAEVWFSAEDRLSALFRV